MQDGCVGLREQSGGGRLEWDSKGQTQEGEMAS